MTQQPNRHSGARNTLSYGEARKVEDLIREVYKWGHYKAGSDDGTVAHTASQRLKFTVTPFNVRAIREAIGFIHQKPGVSLVKAEIKRLEAALAEHGSVVVSAGGEKRGLYIYDIDRYLNLRNGMKKTRAKRKALFPASVPLKTDAALV